MPGTVEGGLKAVETNKQRHGADFYKRIGSKGGKSPTTKPKGFAAMTPEKRAEAGARGGRVSKRKPASYYAEVDVNDKVQNDDPDFFEKVFGRLR